MRWESGDKSPVQATNQLDTVAVNLIPARGEISVILKLALKGKQSLSATTVGRDLLAFSSNQQLTILKLNSAIMTGCRELQYAEEKFQ